MQLNPIGQASLPTYPVRTGKDSRAGLGRWMRRALAAACASGALWMGGCYGSTALGGNETDEPTFTEIVSIVLEQPPLPDDPQPMDGGMMAPAFSCGAAAEWYVGSVPGWLDGSLCGEQPAVTVVDVPAAGRFRIAVSVGAEYVFLSVRDAAGEEAVELTPDVTAAEVELAAGRWTLVATPADPMDNPNAYFEVTIDPVY